MQIEIKERKRMSLFDTLRLAGSDGCDICDDIYDWGTYLGCPESWEKCHDYYDKCMLLFALNLTCLKYNNQAYSTCKVTEFIWNNREPFERFMNEENKLEYTPRYWQKKGETIDPDEDGIFYDVYMETFESLLVGNYSESDYQKLFKYLTKWDKWKDINKGCYKETKAFVDECLNDIELQVEDGEQYLITRYNFSEDPQSMMNLDNLNSLYDGIFKKEDYIVVKISIWKWNGNEGYDYLEPRDMVDVVLAGVTNDADKTISLGFVLKTKGLLKSIFNNHKVIKYLQSTSSKYDVYIESFKVKKEG